MTPRYKGWLRLWLVLAGISLIAVIGIIAADRANQAASPCIEKRYFERVAITIPPNTAPTHPEGTSIHFPRDLTEAEGKEALRKYLKLDDRAIANAMQTSRIELSEDAMGIGPAEVSGCGQGYLMPKPESRTKEPYASAMHEKISSTTGYIAWRLGGAWVIANAIVVASFFLIVWITRGFASKDESRGGNSVGATIDACEVPRQAQASGEISSQSSPSAEQRSKISLVLEYLLHGFAMALGVPIANAAGFGGAIPVMLVVLVFAIGSVCVVWGVRKVLRKGKLRTAVLMLLPIAYFGAYLVGYVAIRS